MLPSSCYLFVCFFLMDKRNICRYYSLFIKLNKWNISCATPYFDNECSVFHRNISFRTHECTHLSDRDTYRRIAGNYLKKHTIFAHYYYYYGSFWKWTRWCNRRFYFQISPSNIFVLFCLCVCIKIEKSVLQQRKYDTKMYAGEWICSLFWSCPQYHDCLSCIAVKCTNWTNLRISSKDTRCCFCHYSFWSGHLSYFLPLFHCPHRDNSDALMYSTK